MLSLENKALFALYEIEMLLRQQPDVAEPDDFVMIQKLKEKFQLLHQSQ